LDKKNQSMHTSLTIEVRSTKGSLFHIFYFKKERNNHRAQMDTKY
jgi:hypothetical protein